MSIVVSQANPHHAVCAVPQTIHDFYGIIVSIPNVNIVLCEMFGNGLGCITSFGKYYRRNTLVIAGRISDPGDGHAR